MQTISLKDVPSQTLTLLLASQLTKLNIYTLVDGNLYMDVFVNDVAIITGVLCLNNNRIVRDSYLGFLGDFTFTDTQGLTDPVYTGLGSRYQLLYISQAELATA
jgi:hypothetical protein